MSEPETPPSEAATPSERTPSPSSQQQEAPSPPVVEIQRMLTDPAKESWSGVAEIEAAVGHAHWAIAGGQMVLLHQARHDTFLRRPTADADIVVDVRAGKRESMVRIAEVLARAGFEAKHSPEGVTKFVRGTGQIDLLAPEGLNANVETLDGGHAIAAPGATQALSRTELVEVQWGDTTGTVVRCPTLFGALVAKCAAATEVPETVLRRQRHLDDIVTLTSIMTMVGPGEDAIATKKDRKRLAAAMAKLDDRNSAWFGVANPGDIWALLSELSTPPSQ